MPKVNHKPIPDIESFLCFVFILHNNKEVIVIDGDMHAIKKVLNHAECTYIDRKSNTIACAEKHIPKLLTVLDVLQSKRLLKFSHLRKGKGGNVKQTTTTATTAATTAAATTAALSSSQSSFAKVYLNGSKKPTKIKVPSVNHTYGRSPLKLKKNDSVKIVAKTVDEVGRVAKLLGVLLCTFEDNPNEFVGIHEKNQTC